jgi:PAS domain S-box-containing protein
MDSKSRTKVPSLLSLKKIFEGTSEYTGKKYFRSLVKNLAEVLEVHGVWITEYLEKENRLNSLAFWLDGKFVEKYEYDVKGTPCEPVLDSKDVCHVPENVIELYPDDPDLPPMDAVSYMGIALRDTNGNIMGHLAMLDQKPMQEIPEVFVIFRLFGARARAELRRIRYEKRLEESESKIRRLINGTMDAIIELDSELRITQANEAAYTVFKEKDGNFIGKNIRNYIRKEDYNKILEVISGFNIKGKNMKAVWIEGYLGCMKTTGDTFFADATMSCYRFNENLFFALFVRDVNDRIEKEEKIKSLEIEKDLLKEKVNADLMGDLIGESESIKNTLIQVEQVASTESTVLIMGETGTGKELIAREIYRRSTRKHKPFITLNCAALPSELIESELFGHVKGAFTGATVDREGRFLLADMGTIFLDEIGELPLALQAKLLRVIQEGEFEPVGSSVTRKVNVRIIAATHKNLIKEVENNNFREDLYYRLNVFPIQVPPLRERGNDIILLAEAFIKKYAVRHGKKEMLLEEIDRQQLLRYTWPGNVRELQNIIERSVIIGNEDMFGMTTGNSRKLADSSVRSVAEKILSSRELQEIEIKNLKRALDKTNGKIFGKNGAARLVGIPPTTFCSKIKKYGIV